MPAPKTKAGWIFGLIGIGALAYALSYISEKSPSFILFLLAVGLLYILESLSGILKEIRELRTELREERWNG